MSFFELDGGKAKKAKPKAKKSTKPKATKTKKTPSGKKKKGGNFLGTVSELFAPAGWESFVTAAGLLALDRTDNFLRKKKDSKKQKGGNEDVNMEERESGMMGGARKRRTQKGGGDGHHTIETLEQMMGGEENEMTGGGAKKKSKGKGRKHRGGAMTEEQQEALYKAYLSSTNGNKNSQNANKYDSFIVTLLTNLGVESTYQNQEEAKLVIDLKKAENLPITRANKKTMINSARTAYTAFLNPSSVSNGTASLNGTIFKSSGQNSSIGASANMIGAPASANMTGSPAPAASDSSGNGFFGLGGKKKAPKKKAAPKKAKKAPKKK
jgi:hypothetical protein